MNFISPDFNHFLSPDCDRLRFITDTLSQNNIRTNIIADNGHNHIYVHYPAESYTPVFKIKTVLVHYDRVSGSAGANDNSAAVWQIMDWAMRLLSFRKTHNVRIIFTDGEELGSVAELGSYGLAARFKKLGITRDDIYVFDCCGRGDVLIVSDRESVPPGDKAFIQKYSSLIQRTKSLAAQTAPNKWMSLPVPYSDNAAFIACGIPAAAFTVLPAQEASEYGSRLIRGEVSADQVLKNSPAVRSLLPATWQHIHTGEDTADKLTEPAFHLMRRLLDNLAQMLTMA